MFAILVPVVKKKKRDKLSLIFRKPPPPIRETRAGQWSPPSPPNWKRCISQLLKVYHQLLQPRIGAGDKTAIELFITSKSYNGWLGKAMHLEGTRYVIHCLYMNYHTLILIRIKQGVRLLWHSQRKLHPGAFKNTLQLYKKVMCQWSARTNCARHENVSRFSNCEMSFISYFLNDWDEID